MLTGAYKHLAVVGAILIAGTASAQAPGVPNLVATPTGEYTPDKWQFWNDWQEMRTSTAGSYGHALRFAECVSAYNAAAATQVMSRPIDDARHRRDLFQIASRYKGCGMRVAVPPVLLRAAFAELSVRRRIMPAQSGAISVGIPGKIKTFPVAALARCQVEKAPTLVMEVLATRPGETSEEIAVKRLFGSTPSCTSLTNGAVTPTAARLALVSAAYALRE
jgi:hypothetical protein